MVPSPRSRAKWAALKTNKTLKIFLMAAHQGQHSFGLSNPHVEQRLCHSLCPPVMETFSSKEGSRHKDICRADYHMVTTSTATPPQVPWCRALLQILQGCPVHGRVLRTPGREGEWEEDVPASCHQSSLRSFWDS